MAGVVSIKLSGQRLWGDGMRRMGLATLVLLMVSGVPAVTSALTFTIDGFRSPNTPVTFAGVTTLNIAGTYGNFIVSNVPGRIAQVIATDTLSVDTLKLTGADFRVGAGADRTASIVYEHFFGTNLGTGSHFFGINITESWTRTESGRTVAATGSTTNLSSHVRFINSDLEGSSGLDQINGTKIHTVGSSTFGPSPTNELIACPDSGFCNPGDTITEMLRTTATLVFGSGTNVRLRAANSWVAAGGCDTEAECDAAIFLEPVDEPNGASALLLGLGLTAIALLNKSKVFRRSKA